MLSFAWKSAKIGAVDVEHSKQQPTPVDDAIPLGSNLRQHDMSSCHWEAINCAFGDSLKVEC